MRTMRSQYSSCEQEFSPRVLVFVEPEPNGEKSCAETSDRLTERLYGDVHENVSAYLVVSGVISQNVGLRGSRNTQRARFVSIPNGVEELCERCFSECRNLSRVTFGESSSLNLIGNGAFCESGVVEGHVPDGIERLLRDLIRDLARLCRVMKLA